MKDSECVHFLKKHLKQMGLRWPGFRKVRTQVCKRIQQRLRALSLPDLNAYEQFLEEHPREWARLDFACRVTISRFYRDRAVFNALRWEILPALAQEARQKGRKRIRCWSAGCASGEEAYTLRIVWLQVWQRDFPDLDLLVWGTDYDPVLLSRAQRASYPASSLKELPGIWRSRAFNRAGELFQIRSRYHRNTYWVRQDIRRQVLDQTLDLLLCRNVAFTYFDPSVQRKVLERIEKRLRAGGYLVLGGADSFPGHKRFCQEFNSLPIYRKRSD